MKKPSRCLTKVASITIVALVMSQNQPAFAGWTGLINGLGVGWASVNVRSSTLQTNRVTTVNNLTSPSAAMSPTTGYKTNAPLPEGAATNTYSRIKGLSGGIWQAASKAAVGDGTDNAELQQRIQITPADCAALTFDSVINQSQAEFNANGNSGTITVNAKATAGTALWLRGFEYTGSMADVPLDNPDTVENESIEYLKVHGLAKFETLVLGPFEFGGANCPLIVPFTLSSSNLENLVFASDAAVLSLPLVVACPAGISVKCDESFSYPPVQVAGCGNISVSYVPAPLPGGVFPAGSFPVGVTPVTVTATDGDGNSTSCSFTVTVTDTVPPVAPVLPTLTGEAFVIVPQPAPATDNCGGVVRATTSDPLLYTNQGTFNVRWNFDDNHGNTNKANQTVIVDDVTAPVPPALPTVTGQCSASVTAPTAQDAVAGTITGTTSDPLTYNSQGTFTVHWTFNDGNGNTSTANQTVIVKDTMPPATPTLANLTFAVCSGTPATPPTPTTTDNCKGLVSGTTTTPFPITAPGTTVVTWTFSDGNGNSTTANQNVTLTGLTFKGFYSPIGTVSNLCTSPVVINQGSVAPIKFDMLCGSSVVTTGQPPIVKIQVWNGCVQGAEPVSANAVFQNDWHYNWDTSGWAKGIYKVLVVLPDQTTRHVFVKLK